MFDKICIQLFFHYQKCEISVSYFINFWTSCKLNVFMLLKNAEYEYKMLRTIWESAKQKIQLKCFIPIQVEGVLRVHE